MFTISPISQSRLVTRGHCEAHFERLVDANKIIIQEMQLCLLKTSSAAEILVRYRPKCGPETRSKFEFRWTRTRPSRARFSGSDTSRRMRCSAAFITTIAETSFRYTQRSQSGDSAAVVVVRPCAFP